MSSHVVQSVDIVEIAVDAALELFQRIQFASETVDLREAGEAGLHAVSDRVIIDELLEIAPFSPCVKRVRTRPHDRHRAFENIEQLRQLVDAQSTNDPADPGHARVVSRGLLRGMGVRLLDIHRAEFAQQEQSPIESGALLIKRTGPGLSNLIASATRSSSGETRAMPTDAMIKSSARLTQRSHP